MELIITPQEVVETAFEGEYGVTAERIGESVIASAQQKFIKPVLGDLYGKIEGDSYPELKQLVKAALAQYVKLLMIPKLAVSMGNGGITQIKGAHFSSAGEDSIKALKESIKAEACALMREAVVHIEQNRDDYPEYDPSDNILHKVSICSGIIL